MARSLGSPMLAAALAAALAPACIGAGPAGADPPPGAAEALEDGAGAGRSPLAEGERAAEGTDESTDESTEASPEDVAEEAADGDTAAGEDGSDEDAAPGAEDRPTDLELREEADRVLDDWHRAAAEVDQEGYLGHLAPDVVFMGTDRTERWDLARFSGYVDGYFSQGQGWSYVPSERYVHLGPSRDVAWFDERLTSASYGELRGTGALRWDGETWRIVHYSMTFTVPNDVARDVVGLIRESSR